MKPYPDPLAARKIHTTLPLFAHLTDLTHVSTLWCYVGKSLALRPDDRPQKVEGCVETGVGLDLRFVVAIKAMAPEVAYHGP